MKHKLILFWLKKASSHFAIVRACHDLLCSQCRFVSYGVGYVIVSHLVLQQGEDYVVVTDNVHTGDPLDDTLEAHRTACVKIAELAMELVEIGNAHISESSGSRTGLKFGFKAGLHHGVLSSGILGRSRRFYRIFGDTVVTSARMCQHTVPGTVQISEEVSFRSARFLCVLMIW